MNIIDCINRGIEIEKRGFNFYYNASKKVKSKKAKETLEFLAKEELRHRKFLEDIKDELIKEGRIDVESKAKILKERIFPEKFEEKISATDDDKIILKEAELLEKNSIAFYTKCRDEIKEIDDAKEVFDILIKFENEHLEWIKFIKESMEVHGYWLGLDDYFSFDGV